MSVKNNDNQVVNAKELMDFLCKFSELLLSWSWEGVSGYEEIIKRVSRVYGHDEIKVNFEAQLANIQLGDKSDFVSVGIPGIPPLADTQLLKDFVTDIVEGKLTLAEANKNLDKIQNKKNPYPPVLVWLGVVIISVGFAVDVVGTWQGLLWAGITATVTGLVFLAPDKIPGFDKISALVATFASGLIVMLAYKFGLITAAPGLLLISATFVFIPGDSISLQAYELANGKWSAGVDRLFYSIIMLVLQLTGAFMAVLITGGAMGELFPSGPVDSFPWWAAYPGRFVFVIGIFLTFQMSKRQFLPALIILWIVTAVAQIATMAWGEIAGTFIATVVGTIMALWLARKPRAIPAYVLMIPIIFALSPGSHGLRQLETWVSGQTITGINDLNTLITIMLAIGMGVVVGRTLGNRWSYFKTTKI